MAHQQKTSSVANELPDDATVVGVMDASQPIHAPVMNSCHSDDTVKADAQLSAPEEAPPPAGLTDQTNFLPTKQVITVFMGLSVALACAFLDQTVYVCSPRFRSHN